MTNHNNQTITEALDEYKLNNGIEVNGEHSKTWVCNIGPFKLSLPNFQWRKKAILKHDLHHIMTGYPCDMTGEFQLATWEFANHPYPHIGAQLFCLPLVTFGLLWSPRNIWKAFLSGRNTTSLYAQNLSHEFMNSPVNILRNRLIINKEPELFDYFMFLKLILTSMLLVFSPFIILLITVFI